jgi:hypothetical protein
MSKIALFLLLSAVPAVGQQFSKPYLRVALETESDCAKYWRFVQTGPFDRPLSADEDKLFYDTDHQLKLSAIETQTDADKLMQASMKRSFQEMNTYRLDRMTNQPVDPSLVDKIKACINALDSAAETSDPQLLQSCK